MPIKSTWHNPEKTIVIVKFEGNWNLDEYHENLDRTVTLIKETGHDVVTIIDFSESGPLPAQWLSVGNRTQRVVAENNIQTVIFGISRYMATFTSLFQRMFPKLMRDTRIVNTFEDALEIAYATLSEEVS